MASVLHRCSRAGPWSIRRCSRGYRPRFRSVRRISCRPDGRWSECVEKTLGHREYWGSAEVADNVGYYLGYKGGRPFVERFGSIFHIRPEHIARSEMFFARHGDKAVLGARFILGLRTWGSMLAGMARMPFWRFQLFSALGALGWALVVGIAGYLLGNNLPLIAAILRGIGIGGVVIVVLIAITLFVLRWRAAQR